MTEPLNPNTEAEAAATPEPAQPEVETAVDIDAIGTAEEAPIGQFDSLGRTDVTAEEQPAPNERLRLTKEQREQLKKLNPSIYQTLKSAEEGNKAPFGYALYEKTPLRGRTGAFGEDPIPIGQTNFTNTGLFNEAEKLLTLNPNDERMARWLAAVGEAVEFNPPEDFGLESLTREGSEWVQVLKVGQGQTIFGRIFDYPKSTGSKLTGAQAISYAAAVSGAGRPSRFPLMSAGWNAFFRPSSNAEWSRYYEQMMENRTELGRSTMGVGFSVSRSMYVEQALRFALDHLTGVSFKTGSDLADRTQVLRYLPVTDIDQFLVGFLAACHPDGYALSIPCGAVGECSHVTELEANLRTMVVHDRNVFTERELYHMLRDKTGEMELESVLSYQAGLRTNQPKIVPIKTSRLTGDEIKIEFYVPSAWDYIESGRRWIERVKVMVDAMISDKTSETKRMQLGKSFMNTAPMRDYGHFVKRIFIGDSVIEENPDDKTNPRLDIEDYLTQASEDATMRENFRRAAIEFQQGAACSIVALPSPECPECGKKPVYRNSDIKNERFQDCVPVDVPMIFFKLALQRLMELGR